jgi:hypothetical protein
MLPSAGFTTKLKSDFSNLPYPGRSDRVPHRNQASRRIDRALPAYLETALFETMDSFPFAANTHRLDVLELFDSEGIVQFD